MILRRPLEFLKSKFPANLRTIDHTGLRFREATIHPQQSTLRICPRHITCRVKGHGRPGCTETGPENRARPIYRGAPKFALCQSRALPRLDRRHDSSCLHWNSCYSFCSGMNGRLVNLDQSLSTVYGDHLAVGDKVGGVFSPHDCRYAELAHDNAAWLSGPPDSVTRAAATANVGIQSGVAVGATRISPALRRSKSAVERIIRAGPSGSGAGHAGDVCCWVCSANFNSLYRLINSVLVKSSRRL